MRYFCPPARFVALCLIVCLVSSMASAAHLAVEMSEAETAWAEISRADLLTVDEERAIGRRLAFLYAQRHTLLKDEVAQTRLDRVAARLRVATGTNALNIIIVKSARPEAVSFPPDHIFITSALFELARTDDELAAVIAHEIAHVASRHLSRLIGQSLSLPAGEREGFPTRAAIITGQVYRFTFPSALDAACLRYEVEADQLAMVWLERAGYRQTTLAILLERLTGRLSPKAQQERAALLARIALLNSRQQQQPASAAIRTGL